MLPLPPDLEGRLADEAAARRAIDERPAPKELPPTAVSVGAAVVTFNDAGHVAGMLRELTSQVARVAVADLSSTDGTAEVIARRFPNLSVTTLALESGFGAAVNAAARQLDQPFLLVLHGDARLREGALDQLYGEVHDPGRKIACAAPRLVDPNGIVELSAGFAPTAWRRWRAWWGHVLPPRIKMLRARAKPKRVAYLAPTARAEVDWVGGAAVLIRRDAFDAVGGMDEDFFLAYGDVDLGVRLRRAGWRVVYDPRARGIHLDRVEESAESRRAARQRYARKRRK